MILQPEDAGDRIPDWIEPTRYVYDNLREGDAIISIFPHAQDFVLASFQPGVEQPRRVDYWLESRLILQATIGDKNHFPRCPLSRTSRSGRE